MDKSRTGALIAVVVGIIFIWMGYALQPRHTLSIVTGVLFIVAGILRFIQIRPAR